MTPSALPLQGLRAVLAPSALRFHRALRNPEAAQAVCLARVLRAIHGSQQAERIAGFRHLRSARDFQDAVPWVTPDALVPEMERIAAGAPRVLTHEPVLRFELSGGSSGASKRVPMTRGLLAEFQRALSPMLFELLHRRPSVRVGPSYWSISPLARKQERTAGGIPVGSAEDSAYFSRAFRPLLSRIFAVPGDVGALPDVESCRYVTLWHLVACEDLTLISVWNPSFLTLLMAALERHGERLVEDLRRGVCRPPASGVEQDEPALRHVLSRMRFRPRPERASRLDDFLRSGGSARALWPRLSLLSMWTDAQAAHALPAACQRFPGVEVQGKGLLATEGVVTVPLFDAPAPVLAVRSHFYEFIDPEQPTARPRLAHELEQGRTYGVLMSTSGGLLRYRLGDLVRVEGFREATPCLRFVGRSDAVCDLVGEKLSATRVGAVLDAVLPELFEGARPSFAMLAPEWAPSPSYVLFLETHAPSARLTAAAEAVERALCEGHHYRYARELGQLGAVRAVRVVEGVRRYEARCVALGQRAGDIKPVDLHRLPGWADHFSGAAA